MTAKTFDLAGYVTTMFVKPGVVINRKEDFIKWAKSMGWQKVSLNERPDYLITSSVSLYKSIKAKNKGIPILTYKEALKLIVMSSKILLIKQYSYGEKNV